MSWNTKASRYGGVILTALILCGCLPGSNTGLEEEKDPHFITGKNKANGYDYQGAAESFGRALETNPRSASAHFEIGLLYYQHLKEPAAAIYHFQRFLYLNPKHPRAETTAQFIQACKQELARTVTLGPINLQVQKELDRLVSTNTVLVSENNRQREHIQQLQAEMSNLRSAPRNSLDQGGSQTASQTPLASNKNPVGVSPQPPQGQTNSSAGSGNLTQTGKTRPDLIANQPSSVGQSQKLSGANSTSQKTPAQKTYTVVSGDTPAKIGRRFGLQPDKILAANPGLDPRKLKVGMVIKIP